VSEITETRRTLKAAVEPLLREGETVTVSAAPSTYEAGLSTLGFNVTVTIGDAALDTTAERLDELLEPEGGIRAALQETGAAVTKTSGYRAYQGPDGPVLGAEWTAHILT